MVNNILGPRGGRLGQPLWSNYFRVCSLLTARRVGPLFAPALFSMMFGIMCWMPPSNNWPHLLDVIARAFPFLLAPDSDRSRGVAGAREVSWTPTELSLALLEPSLTPLPFRKKEKKSHVRSLSRPPPLRYCKVTAVTGSRRHSSGANLLFSDPSLLASLDYDICFWLFVAPILSRSS